MQDSRFFARRRVGVWCDYSDIDTHPTYGSDYSLSSVKLLFPKVGDIILDNGCGNGRFSLILSGIDRTVVALDISPFMARATKERKLKNTNVIIADSQNLPFSPSIFDKILCIHNMWYIPLYEKAVCEMIKVGKFEGRIVMDQISEKWSTQDSPVYSRIIYLVRDLVDRLLYRFGELWGGGVPCFYRRSDQFLRPFKKYHCLFYSVPSPPILYQILGIFPVVRSLVMSKLWSYALVKGFEKSARRWLVVCEKVGVRSNINKRVSGYSLKESVI